jgi:hypothetical protein
MEQPTSTEFQELVNTSSTTVTPATRGIDLPGTKGMALPSTTTHQSLIITGEELTISINW